MDTFRWNAGYILQIDRDGKERLCRAMIIYHLLSMIFGLCNANTTKLSLRRWQSAELALWLKLIVLFCVIPGKKN